MSDINVELVRSIYDDYSRGEGRAALQAFDPHVEWIPPPGSPTPSWQGQAGVRASMTDWSDIFEGFRVDVRELVDAGDRVLVAVGMQGRGRESELEIDWDQFHVWTVRHGKVTRMEMFFRRDEAAQAAQLES